MPGPFTDPQTVNRVAEFIRTYDSTIGAIIGALVSILLLYLYDRHRFAPRLQLTQVSSSVSRSMGKEGVEAYWPHIQIDSLNTGGSAVSLTRGKVRLFEGRKLLHEFDELSWVEPSEDRPRRLGKPGVDLAGVLFPPYVLTTFTFLFFVVRDALSQEAWAIINQGKAKWDLVCPLSSGKTLIIPLQIDFQVGVERSNGKR